MYEYGTMRCVKVAYQSRVSNSGFLSFLREYSEVLSSPDESCDRVIGSSYLAPRPYFTTPAKEPPEYHEAIRQKLVTSSYPRIKFKNLILVPKAKRGLAPSCLMDAIH